MSDFAKVFAVGVLFLVGLFALYSLNIENTQQSNKIYYHKYIEPTQPEKTITIEKQLRLIPVISPELEHIELAQKVVVSFDAFERTILNEKNLIVKNGFGGYKEFEKTVEIPKNNLEIVKIVIEPVDSNYYGKLRIYFNGEEIYSGFLQNKKEILISPDKIKEENKIVVKCDSSTWRLWAPTTYIFNLMINASYFSMKSFEMPFIVKKEPKDIDSVRVLWRVENKKGDGKLFVEINGHLIYSGNDIRPMVDVKPDKIGLSNNKENIIKFYTEEGAKYEIENIELILFYKEKKQQIAKFYISTDEYEKMKKAVLNFTVSGTEGKIEINVTDSHGKTHTILSNKILEKGEEYSVEIPKEYLSSGENKISFGFKAENVIIKVE